MRVFWLLPLFFTLSSIARDSIYYDSLISSKQGDYLSIKYKSKVSGKKQRLNVQVGEWRFLDSNGMILKIIHYSYSKKQRTSFVDGDFIHFHPESGDTLLHRFYKMGQLQWEKAYAEAVIVEKHRIITLSIDFLDNYEITYYIPDRSPSFNTLVKTGLEDPQARVNMIDYLSWEDSLGDPSLLQKASFDIYHRHNYISNPGFEHLNLYRSTMSFTREVRNWLPASESPDLFISSDYAHSGNSFIGFRVFTLTKDIEYVQNQLKAPLKKDSLYCFSAYIQLSPGSKFASNAIGIKFSNHPMEIPLDQLYAVKADIQLESQILSFKSKWMRIECLYKAKGGEKWMILGSFKDHMSLKLTPVPGNIYESYYYLDDVSLVPVQDPSLCHCNFNDSRLTQTISSHADTLALDHLKVGETLVLRNIHFENDESELLPGSFATLMAVLEFLRSHPRAVVEISGHTSSTGDYEHNMDLSSRRAKAVQQFLVVNGVASERIKVQGYGPDKPIADNGTKEGQGLNRRVEFRLLKI